jgi:Zn-dependent protease/predicted transcriptional regulator
MGNGFRAGKIFGITIRIDWSWLFIVLLVTWNLSILFGGLHPNWSLALIWGTAVVAALLFFASVLAHELAHSLVARSQGVPVRSITLFLFGGVSNIQRDPSSPGAEFLLTIVGPITSIVLGVIFALLAGVSAGSSVTSASFYSRTGAAARLSPLSTLLLWLGPINILVGVFNLIPGFPLDGGRLVRSILWAITNNLRLATRWASWLGQLIAWLMIAVGIAMIFGINVPFLGTGFVSGLWLAFIGWFLNTASAQSYRQVVVHDLLEGVSVERVMRANPPTVPPDCQISSLVEDHVMGTDDHAFPVVDNGQLLGMVTLEDVRALSRDEWQRTTVRDIMTPVDQLVTVDVQDDMSDALDKLQGRDVGQLPVLRDGQLAGLLRRRDIIKWLQIHADENRFRP